MCSSWRLLSRPGLIPSMDGGRLVGLHQAYTSTTGGLGTKRARRVLVRETVCSHSPNVAGIKNHLKNEQFWLQLEVTQLSAEQGSFSLPQQVFFWSGFFQVEIIPSTWLDS